MDFIVGYGLGSDSEGEETSGGGGMTLQDVMDAGDKEAPAPGPVAAGAGALPTATLQRSPLPRPVPTARRRLSKLVGFHWVGACPQPLVDIFWSDRLVTHAPGIVVFAISLATTTAGRLRSCWMIDASQAVLMMGRSLF